MSQASINFANSAIEQVGERHKQLVESANAALLRSRSRNGKFTSRHVWTQGELTDVCCAFILNYKEKTLAEIAKETHTRFTEYIKTQDHHRHQAIESDSDDELICEAVEYREGVPSVSAIELKLIDCVSLCYQVSSESCSKASKMHTEIWQHIMCAQKHREIIHAMKNAAVTSATSVKSEQQQQQQQDEPRTPRTPKNSNSSSTASLEAPGAPVKAKKTATPPPRRKYLLESEEELPPAKRRKLNPDFEAVAPHQPAQQQQRLSMSDICCALDEIADRMEEHGQCEKQYSHSVAQSIAVIRQNQSDIALLMGYVQDTHTGIQKAYERIEAELAKLETMTVVPAAATTTATATTTTKPKFDPNNYQCHECLQTFDPSIRGYWLIGAPCRNPNTNATPAAEDDEDDMFYLCRECTRFENEHGGDNDMAIGVMEDGEYDYDDQYEDQYERARREHYDHSEECS